MLKTVLEASRTKKKNRLDWIRSERERFAHEELITQERADLCRGRLHEVHFAALQKLDKLLQEKRQFEEKIALEPACSPDESGEELEELCRIASEVPTLWHHEAMTQRERKEILRCLIDSIVVAASKEQLDARILWKSGGNSTLSLWRPRSRHHLIRELHAEQLTPAEIKERLARGETSTGQVVNITVAGIQVSLKKMRLKPVKRSMTYLSVRQKATELDREGQSLQAIARYFNEVGLASPSGRQWTHYMVDHLLHANRHKQESLESIHRNAIGDGLGRGLNYQQIAIELNQKNIRRRGALHWTAKAVSIRWSDLCRMHRKRQTESTDIKLTQRVVLKKSA